MATKLTPVGSQFQVNLVTANNQGLPDIAPLAADRFAMVFETWANTSATDIDIYVQFVNANGTLSGGLVAIASLLRRWLQSLGEEPVGDRGVHRDPDRHAVFI